MPLNKEMLLRVADAIARENVAKFSMENWVYAEPACGTSACIAGHVVLMNMLDNGVDDAQIDRMARNFSMTGIAPIAFADEGAKLLGLSSGQAFHLFHGGPYSLRYLTSNRCRVVGALRWMAETGEIDWRAAFMATGGEIELGRDDD